jgi:hypothetical protein
MRFLVAAIVLSLLTPVGYTQETKKFPMPKDFKGVSADDIVKPPPPTSQSTSIPPQFQQSWFERHWYLAVLVVVIVVGAVAGSIWQRFRLQK